MKSSVDDLREVLFGGVEAPYNFLREVVPAMLEQGEGQVLVFTSAASARPTPGAPLYSSGRAAANMLVRNVAAEVAGKGVQVNAIGTNFMDFPAFLKASQRRTQNAAPGLLRARLGGPKTSARRRPAAADRLRRGSVRDANLGCRARRTDTHHASIVAIDNLVERALVCVPGHPATTSAGEEVLLARLALWADPPHGNVASVALKQDPGSRAALGGTRRRRLAANDVGRSGKERYEQGQQRYHRERYDHARHQPAAR